MVWWRDSSLLTAPKRLTLRGYPARFVSSWCRVCTTPNPLTSRGLGSYLDVTVAPPPHRFISTKFDELKFGPNVLPNIPDLDSLAVRLQLTPGQLTAYSDLLRLNRLRKWDDFRGPYRYRTVAKRTRPSGWNEHDFLINLAK